MRAHQWVLLTWILVWLLLLQRKKKKLRQNKNELIQISHTFIHTQASYDNGFGVRACNSWKFCLAERLSVLSSDPGHIQEKQIHTVPAFILMQFRIRALPSPSSASPSPSETRTKCLRGLCDCVKWDSRCLVVVFFHWQTKLYIRVHERDRKTATEHWENQILFACLWGLSKMKCCTCQISELALLRGERWYLGRDNLDNKQFLTKEGMESVTSEWHSTNNKSHKNFSLSLSYLQ